MEPKVAVFDLFSKRQKRLRGEITDIYSYDSLPEQIKIQILHIIKDAMIDGSNYFFEGNCYSQIVKIMRKEIGVFKLVKYPESDQEELFKYFLECVNVELALDVVELCFISIDDWVRKKNREPNMAADDAIKELNQRFREAGIGYQYENRQIIRIDSQLVHSEVVKPALFLLSQNLYENAEQEFLVAHKHYRNERYQECLTSCAKAFESVMKIICEKRKWEYSQNDTASKLIDIVLKKELIPAHLLTQFNALRSLLESGIPTVRNKQAAHGQGAKKIEVPGYLASYLLHQTASTILMLVQAEEAL